MSQRIRAGRRFVAWIGVTILWGCVDREGMHRAIDQIKRGPALDSIPIIVTETSPFQYPKDLYDQRVQGNVMLRVRIDTAGLVAADSTVVLESSGYARLDSAALTGASQLRFRPARMKGRPLSVAVRVPVLFRHPGAVPLPGDSAVHAREGRAPATRPAHRQP